MKKCPYCAEEIQDEAIKCRYCNEFLQKPVNYQGFGQQVSPQSQLTQAKWYNNPVTILIGVFCVGPLVLPLVWTNKKFSTQTKVIITVAMLVVTYLMINWTIQIGNDAIKKYQDPMNGLSY